MYPYFLTKGPYVPGEDALPNPEGNHWERVMNYERPHPFDGGPLIAYGHVIYRKPLSMEEREAFGLCESESLFCW